jgi:hypothetical protein
MKEMHLHISEHATMEASHLLSLLCVGNFGKKAQIMAATADGEVLRV